MYNIVFQINKQYYREFNRIADQIVESVYCGCLCVLLPVGLNGWPVEVRKTVVQRPTMNGEHVFQVVLLAQMKLD